MAIPIIFNQYKAVVFRVGFSCLMFTCFMLVMYPPILNLEAHVILIITHFPLSTLAT